jgi:hypothetical protein
MTPRLWQAMHDSPLTMLGVPEVRSVSLTTAIGPSSMRAPFSLMRK